MLLDNEYILWKFNRSILIANYLAEPSEQWRIFMTTEHSDKIPLQLLHLCEKVSYKTIVSVTSNKQWWSIDNDVDNIKHNIVSSIKVNFISFSFHP